MRVLIWIAAALVIFLARPASAAAWEEYERADLGYQLEFPGKPTETQGTYTSTLVENAPTHIATVRTDTGIFTATVVDLYEREKEGASLMGEAEFLLHLLGDVAGISTSRLPPGKAAIFGRFITINMRQGRISEQPGQTEGAQIWFKKATGIEVPDGSRMTTNMFFHHGRLYLIQGVNLPAGDVMGPAATRFVQSLSWTNLPAPAPQAPAAQ